MPHRWADFITPSTLQLSPLLEVLLEPIGCAQQQAALQLGLQEVLVNAVRHGNRNDPGKCLRVRRIVTPRWWLFQLQDQGCGVPSGARGGALPCGFDTSGQACVFASGSVGEANALYIDRSPTSLSFLLISTARLR